MRLEPACRKVGSPPEKKLAEQLRKENSMKKRKKYSFAEILMGICCGIGCLLIGSSKLIDSKLNLLMIGIAFNGVGIAALLYVSGQSKKVD